MVNKQHKCAIHKSYWYNTHANSKGMMYWMRPR